MADIRPPPLRDPNIRSKQWEAWFKSLDPNTATKANKVVGGTTGNLVDLAADGDISDAGYSTEDLEMFSYFCGLML